MRTKLAQMSVLVVEDHDFQRQVALRLLQHMGVATALEAADGRSALAVLGRQQHPVDVVLVDLDLPHMDGIEFIGHVAQERLAHAIVVLTALDPALLNTVRIMARASGIRVLGTVEKPLTEAKLGSVMDLYFTADLLADETPQPEIDEGLLAEALASDAFEAWFQPQVAIGSGFVTGVEALARWSLNGHSVPPARFIPELERCKLIDALTERILTQACRWRARWREAGLDLGISVNVSMHNLEDTAAADRYQAIVQAAGVDTRDVTLEITESSMMHEAAPALNVLARLRLKGFGLSVDDFGTGWSSLSQLAQLPVTELKIDQGFINGATAEPRNRAVVEASLELGRKLGLTTVAEGVRNVEEWQMLAELGCTRAQGELIGMAVPGDQLAAAIEKWRRRQP
ncbi:MAG TPA: EAL domain-containing response regulator [Rhodanobacteraceae bacterium]|jgi:EAL domain-containing protein (putative c-di-GMP-specific phosphodiesterase class I)|nr:EAL domain-containing response regulator [Rhodanobacteraceae bacterium]